MSGSAEGGCWPDRLWDPDAVRARALELLGGEALESFRLMSESDVRALAHELRVHQVELEMQNEELRRALEERDEALDKYSDLYDFAPIGLLSFDVGGRIVEANLTAAALLSVYRGSLVGSTFQTYLVSRSLPVFDRFLRAIVATGSKRSCDVEAVAHDGRRLTLRVDGLAYAPDAGSAGWVRAGLTDVTESRDVERALRESEEHFRSVVESAGDGIVTVDSEGAVVLWNPAAARMFGYTVDQIRGRPVSTVMPEGLRGLHTEAMDQAVLSGTSRIAGAAVERVALRADGTEFPVEVVFARWRSGSREFFTGIVRDLSERKRAEEEHERLQDQLRQALKMESVGRLAGGVAHDMNNMLTPILGYAEMLLEDTDDTDPRRPDVEEIARAAARARDLTRQLLAFARKQTLEMRLLDLNTAIRGFETMLRRMLREDVVLELSLAPSLAVVRGDVGQLEQVLLNLAINAQDAMPEGGTISVETGESVVRETLVERATGVAPGAYVVMTVADSGEGMPPEILENLFEPFFTSKGPGRGTGLGLATVYGIVKQHGGDILVQSEPGRGTVFKVYLPRADGLAGDEAVEGGEQPARGTETVLVVEDQERVRALVAQSLRRYGYRVLEASGGDEALARVAAHSGPLHLLLTDVVMPGLNGPALASRLCESLPGLSVLYMSGYADDALGRDGVLADEVELIQKPFSARELAARVRRLLDG